MKTPVRGRVVAAVVAVLAFLAVASIGSNTVLLASHSQEFAAIQAVQHQQVAQANKGAALLKRLRPVVAYLEAAADYTIGVEFAICNATPGCVIPGLPPPSPPPIP